MNSIYPPPATTVLPFVAQFPVSTANFVQTYQPHIGQKTPRGKFAPPTKATSTNITAFIQALHDYEANPTAAGVTQLNNFLKALDMSAIRLQESPNDAVIFYPNPTKGKNTPLVTGAALVWRFGAVQVPGDSSTYNNPLPQFFVYDPHSGQDGTIYAVTTQFLAGAKGLLSNAFNPNVAPNPKYKPGKITPSNIKRFADPAHSNTTAFVPFVTAIAKIYKQSASTVTHGMSGKANFQMLANNDYNGHFLKGGKPSFTTMLAIALAIEQLPNGSNPSLPINPNVVTLCSSLPGYIVRNNVKAPLVSANNRNAPLRLHKGGGNNSDCVGHMANGAVAPFHLGKQTDRSMFIEFGGKFRNNGSHLMTIFAAAQQKAVYWYMQYDPAIQDPWQLAARFPDVYNNMSLYPNLFDSQFIYDYKTNGINPYNNTSIVAAIVDQEFAITDFQNLAASSFDISDLDDIDDAAFDASTDAPAEPAAENTAMTFAYSAKTKTAGSGYFSALAAEPKPKPAHSHVKLRV